MLALLLPLALAAAATPSMKVPASPDGIPLAEAEMFAEVRVNDVDTGLVVRFTGGGADLAASGDDLRELGIETTAGATPLRLHAIAGLAYRVDHAEQTVHIDVAIASMRRVEIAAPAIPVEEVPSAWGGLLNYALYADANGHGGATGETRLFGPLGTLSSGFLVRREQARRGLDVQRLETRFVREDPRNMRRLTIGDFIAPDGSADGAIRGAGVQFATDFTLQPDLVTAPMPHLSGGGGVPSTVDLYVNGVRRLTQDVGAGRFAVAGVPMVDGAGQVSLLVRDVLGHESVQQVSFYSARQLLRPGLTASSLQAGLLRIDAFGPGDRYGAAFVSATVRRGMTDRITTEARIAAAGPVQLAGASMTAKLGEIGIASLSGDVSHSDRGAGGATSISVRRDDRRFSVFAAAQKTFGGFETLAGPSRSLGGWRLQAGGSWQSRAFGGLSFSGTLLQENDARTRILAASWSRSIGRRLCAFVNAIETSSGHSELLVATGITIALSPRSSASVQAGRNAQGASASASWSRAAAPDGGASWRAGVSTGAGQSRLLGGATYRGASGEIGADVQLDRRGPAAQVFASGAAIWFGGRPELAARIGESFAMVRTGQPDVGVTLENRPAGRTRQDGSLLLPSLPANAPARIALDYDGIDLDHEAAHLDRVVRTRGAGGAIVSMPVRLVHAVTLRLVGPSGQPMPLGSIVRRPNGREDVVGYDGIAYLTDVDATVSAEVRNGESRCRITFSPDVHDPVVCR